MARVVTSVGVASRYGAPDAARSVRVAPCGDAASGTSGIEPLEHEGHEDHEGTRRNTKDSSCRLRSFVIPRVRAASQGRRGPPARRSEQIARGQKGGPPGDRGAVAIGRSVIFRVVQSERRICAHSDRSPSPQQPLAEPIMADRDSLSQSETTELDRVVKEASRCKECSDCPGFVTGTWPKPSTDCNTCGHRWQSHR